MQCTLLLNRHPPLSFSVPILTLFTFCTDTTDCADLLARARNNEIPLQTASDKANTYLISFKFLEKRNGRLMSGPGPIELAAFSPVLLPRLSLDSPSILQW